MPLSHIQRSILRDLRRFEKIPKSCLKQRRFIDSFLDFSGIPAADFQYHIGRILTAWPRYTGEFFCPVPSPYSHLTCMEAALLLHPWVGLYGNLHTEFLNYLIEGLEALDGKVPE